jgi:hypothetical protein
LQLRIELSGLSNKQSVTDDSDVIKSTTPNQRIITGRKFGARALVGPSRCGESSTCKNIWLSVLHVLGTFQNSEHRYPQDASSVNFQTI